MNSDLQYRHVALACALMVMIFLGACQLDSLKDPIIVPDVEREFYIDLWEDLYPESRELVFKIETIKEQDCVNASISYNLNKTGNTLKLSLNNISAPADCQQGPARIFADASAGRISGGIYTMKLDLKNTVFNEGQLTVSGDAYRLDMNTEYGFTLRHKNLLRVPEQTLWGYVAYETAEQASVAADFVQSLRDASTDYDFREGYYGYFSVETAAPVSIHHEGPETAPHQAFVLKYEGDGTAVRAQIDAFRAAHGAPFSLKVFNAKGQTW